MSDAIILRGHRGSKYKQIEVLPNSAAGQLAVSLPKVQLKLDARAAGMFDALEVKVPSKSAEYLNCPEGEAILLVAALDEGVWHGLREDSETSQPTDIIETVVTSDGYTLRLGKSLNSIYSERTPSSGASYSQSSGGWGKTITRFEEHGNAIKVYAGDVLVGKVYNYNALIHKC